MKKENSKTLEERTSYKIIHNVTWGFVLLCTVILYIFILFPFLVVLLDILFHLTYDMIYDITVNVIPKLSYDSVMHYLSGSMYSLFISTLYISKIVVFIAAILFVLYVIGDAQIKIATILKRKTRFTIFLKKHKIILDVLLFVIIFWLYNTYGLTVLHMIDDVL